MVPECLVACVLRFAHDNNDHIGLEATRKILERKVIRERFAVDTQRHVVGGVMHAVSDCQSCLNNSVTQVEKVSVMKNQLHPSKISNKRSVVEEHHFKYLKEKVSTSNTTS